LTFLNKPLGKCAYVRSTSLDEIGQDKIDGQSRSLFDEYSMDSDQEFLLYSRRNGWGIWLL